jgi:hypothetical protein
VRAESRGVGEMRLEPLSDSLGPLCEALGLGTTSFTSGSYNYRALSLLPSAPSIRTAKPSRIFNGGLNLTSWKYIQSSILIKLLNYIESSYTS